MGHRRLLPAALFAALVLVLGACAAAPDPARDPASCQGRARPLTIATGAPDGVYAALGSALAARVSATTPLQVTAVQSGSTLRNVQQLGSGDFDVAFTQADSATDAVKGQGVFAEPQKIQALARLYSDNAQVVVGSASGIAGMADFRGKRIGTGPAESGTELLADRLLTAAGLAPRTDVQAQQLDLGASVAALRAGTVDGFVWSGGVPTPAIGNLLRGGQARLVDVGGLLPALQRVDEVYTAATIPASAYGTSADVPTIAMPNLLVVRDDFSPADACALTTVLFRDRATLAATVPAAAGLDPRTAADTGPIELNSGARAALAALAG